MDTIRITHTYCEDSPVIQLPPPPSQQVRLALKVMQESQATARRLAETLRGTILRVHLMAKVHSSDPT